MALGTLTYTTLVDEIQNYTENQFTTAVVNTFITQAEQRIYNTVQLPALRKNVTGSMTSGNKYLAIPSDWLSTFSLAVINADNEYLYLLNKDVNFPYRVTAPRANTFAVLKDTGGNVLLTLGFKI